MSFTRKLLRDALKRQLGTNDISREFHGARDKGFDYLDVLYGSRATEIRRQQATYGKVQSKFETRKPKSHQRKRPTPIHRQEVNHAQTV